MQTQSTSADTGIRWEMTDVGQPLVQSSLELDTPGNDEAWIQVAGCGVCHTDLGFLYDGVKPRCSLPLALGHEISGIVVSVGAGFAHLEGKAVIVPAVTPCGSCDSCRAGHGTICAKQLMPGNDVQGGFATHVRVPARGLCVVDDPAALTGETIGKSGCTLAELSVVADAVTTPYQAIDRAKVTEGDVVVVVGLGGVGGFAVQIANALGATVVGVDIQDEKLKALEPYGLAHGLNAKNFDTRTLRKEVRSFCKAQGLPLTRWKIFECSGSAPGQELAWSLLVHGAYLSVVGYTLPKIEVRLSNLMAFDAKAVGNWGCLPELYPAALDLVLQGRVALAPFVETHPLSNIQEVLEGAHEHRFSRRPVLVP